MQEKNAEQKILEIATGLFAKNGYEGTSIRDICQKANINISMISYYFGGKKGLYEKILGKIVDNIIGFMKGNMKFKEFPPDFSGLTKKERIEFLFKIMNLLIDYFYSERISDNEIMIFFREQISSGTEINAIGYKIFRKLLASILEKDENDKEVIFRAVSFVGQIQSARIYKQFSLNMMNQESYSQEDNILFKNIVLNQIKAILKDVGSISET